MIGSLSISLFLTIIIELLLALLIRVKNKDNLSTIIWVNCLTNPIVVFLTNISLFLNNILITNLILYLLEIIVVPVEGYLFRKNLKEMKINAYTFSLYLNVLSFSCGLLINYILKT